MVYRSKRRLTLDTKILFNSTYLQRYIKLYALLFRLYQITRRWLMIIWLITSYLGALYPQLLFCWKLIWIHEFLKPQAGLRILGNLIFFCDNSDIVISTVFIFSMEMFSLYRFLDVHHVFVIEINQWTLFIAGSQNVCMHTVLFTILIEIFGV